MREEVWRVEGVGGVEAGQEVQSVEREVWKDGGVRQIK